MRHTVPSRAARYNNINYELWYCLVRFLNHKGCECFETRARTSCNNRDGLRGSLKAQSTLMMRRNSLTSLRCVLHEKINRKIIMLQKLFQVCSFSSISSVWTWHCLSLRDTLYIFCVYLKWDTSVHYPGGRLHEVHGGGTRTKCSILAVI